MTFRVPCRIKLGQNLSWLIYLVFSLWLRGFKKDWSLNTETSFSPFSNDKPWWTDQFTPVPQEIRGLQNTRKNIRKQWKVQLIEKDLEFCIFFIFKGIFVVILQKGMTDSQRHPWNIYPIDNFKVFLKGFSSIACRKNAQVSFVENSRFLTLWT